jgi:hypothetical protein
LILEYSMQNACNSMKSSFGFIFLCLIIALIKTQTSLTNLFDVAFSF